MARYYFHVFNDAVTTDEEGIELPDNETARARGMIEARNLAAHSIVTYGHLMLDHRIEIANDAGSIFAKIEFGDAVEIRRSNAPDGGRLSVLCQSFVGLRHQAPASCSRTNKPSCLIAVIDGAGLM